MNIGKKTTHLSHQFSLKCHYDCKSKKNCEFFIYKIDFANRSLCVFEYIMWKTYVHYSLNTHQNAQFLIHNREGSLTWIALHALNWSLYCASPSSVLHYLFDALLFLFFFFMTVYRIPVNEFGGIICDNYDDQWPKWKKTNNNKYLKHTQTHKTNRKLLECKW